MYSSILVYADEAEHALEAVKHVQQPSHKLEEVTFLYIHPVSAHLPESPPDRIRLVEQLYAHSDFFHEAKDYLDKLNIKHKTVIRMGNPAQEISLITQFDRYDCLVVAKAASEEAAAAITQKAKCPVVHVDSFNRSVDR
ncbi:universal stress protein [Bacillus thermotolerans]|uniref:universal stress protein n=1 Tax=Bacillus thermotolerans TaxID=1221996 RepID=UPI00057DEE96|nr:universal stress protein [Bacillus thermotolerans]KKB33293.1 hypothetical protein QY97_03559 [Bacillus thermotolerans]